MTDQLSPAKFCQLSLALATAVGSMPAQAECQTAATVLTAQEELRLGSGATDDDALTRIGDLEFAGDGRVFLTQWQKPWVAVFDSNGLHQVDLGREGSGPGEFRAPSTMGWIGDTLWIIDSAALRVEFWDSKSGKYLTTVSLAGQSSGIWGPSVPIAVLSDMSVLATATPSPRLVERRGQVAKPYYKLHGNLSAADTIILLPNGVRDVRVRIPNGMFIQARHPTGTADLIAVGPGGAELVVVDRASPTVLPGYRVSRIDHDGDTLVSAAISSRRRELEPSEKHLRIRRLAESVARGHALPVDAVHRAIADAVTFPADLPAVDDVVVSRDGCIWLRRTPELSIDSAATWHILDKELRETATVQLPVNLTVLRVSGTQLFGWMRGDMDVPYVVRYRLRPRGSKTVRSINNPPVREQRSRQ